MKDFSETAGRDCRTVLAGQVLDRHDLRVADQRRGSRRWPWLCAAWLAWSFVAADGISAAWSLIAAQPWNWNHFESAVGPALGGAVGSTLGQVLARRGVVPARPKVRRTLQADEETDRAIRTGTLPSDADPREWRPRIARRVRGFVRVLWAVAALCLIAAVLTFLAAHLTSHDDPWLGVLGAVALLLASPPLLLANRLRNKVRLLLAQL